MHLKLHKLVEANFSMLVEINEIYLKCREHLFENGILQWDDQYPNKEYFRECIENNNLFVLMNDAEIVGHVVLNEWESDEWNNISWEGNKPIIVHSLMINPLIQGKGIGTEFVKQCEELAIERGYKSVRLDAYSGNEKALRLYEKLGYHRKGSVFFTSKPVGYQEYICFEKSL